MTKIQLGIFLFFLLSIPNFTFGQSQSELETFKEIAEQYRLLKVKPQMSEEARKYLVQAQAAYEEKRYENAINLYEKAIKVEPALPKAYLNRAMLLGNQGEYCEAVIDMKKYLMLVPDATNAREVQDKSYIWEEKCSKIEKAKRLREEQEKADQKAKEEQEKLTQKIQEEEKKKINGGHTEVALYRSIPTGNFADNSLNNPKSGYAMPGYEFNFTFSLYTYKRNKIGTGFAFRDAISYFPISLPFAIDTVGKYPGYNPVVDTLGTYPGSAKGGIVSICFQIGWGVGYKINKKQELGLKILYGIGGTGGWMSSNILANGTECDYSGVGGSGLSLPGEIDLDYIIWGKKRGFKVNLGYGFGNQQWASDGYGYIFENKYTKIGYERIRLGIGIVFWSEN